jgi:hypothetical protein
MRPGDYVIAQGDGRARRVMFNGFEFAATMDLMAAEWIAEVVNRLDAVQRGVLAMRQALQEGDAAFARAVVDDVWDVLESVMPREVEDE